MEYHGKLYGKIGNKYFDTCKSSADFDKLKSDQTQIEKLEAEKKELLERIEIYKECFELYIDPRVWDEATEFLSTAKSGLAKELSRKEK